MPNPRVYFSKIDVQTMKEELVLLLLAITILSFSYSYSLKFVMDETSKEAMKKVVG
jgi:hypothetical protein